MKSNAFTYSSGLWEHYQHQYASLTNSTFSFKSGTLIMLYGQKSVFIVDEGVRRPFTGIQAFLSLGRNFDEVKLVSKLVLRSFCDWQALV